MILHGIYDWKEPPAILPALHGEPDLICLYSAFSEAHTGRYSFIGWHRDAILSGDDWGILAPHLSADRPWHENAWFGWLGYGLRHATETLPHAGPSPIAHPALCMMRFSHLLRFDHHARHIEYYHNGSAGMQWQDPAPSTATTPPNVTSLTSNMSKESYLDKVKATIGRIHAGDFYQANITRKFNGTWDAEPDSVALFTQLCGVSPAPYSAYIRHGGDRIISSSPECFLCFDAAGSITARPIKGSAAKSEDPHRDETIRNALKESVKDHAENRMIVDLMRNDLSRVSKAGSVTVTENATIHSYATIHHLIPTIRASKREGIPTLQAVAQCFPPGSMTGAPKIAAMQWCALQEGQERDIYSGAIGWFAGDGSCDLSVVIRTLIIRGSHFEFQVGGGIVADSVPGQEWQETLTKARAIRTILGIPPEALEAL